MNTPNQETTDEAALAYLIAWLRNRIERQPNGDGRALEPYGFDLYHDFLKAKLNTEPINPRSPEIVRAKIPFLNMIWDLCGRGILRPSAVSFDGGHIAIGNHFALTSYGIRWLQNPGIGDANPMEYTRFAQLLARHDARFGDAYRLRASEAVRCYEGRTYFACCAMCGAQLGELVEGTQRNFASLRRLMTLFDDEAEQRPGQTLRVMTKKTITRVRARLKGLVIEPEA